MKKNLGSDFKTLECVVLTNDLSMYGLRAGDLGTIIEVYPGGGLEVEFVACSGETKALVRLSGEDVRRVDSCDLLTTRRLAKARK